VRSRFQLLGGSQLEAKAKRVLQGLGFPEADFCQPARNLSGGRVMRVHLARLLVMEPDLLLLDEPTNHLDLEALDWFQDWLEQFAGGVLVISHDREFLNRAVDAVVELRQGRAMYYRGNYDAFLTQRAAAEQQWLAAYKHQQRELARLQLFVDRFRAKNTKATQAQSKLKQIERIERIDAPTGPEATIDFEFPQPVRSGQKVIILHDVDFAYGEQVIYRGLDFLAERGQRIVLVGPNGAGKSTLLKLLAGVLEPQQGRRHLGYHVRCGYYSQYRVEMLRPERTVIEEAFDTPQQVSEVFVRTVLGGFLFPGDDVFKKVAVLSGGEKSRLALVKLLLDPPNLLLMDEPTTHLDLASVDALLAALDQFQGTLVFISHDAYFVRSLANHVVRIQDGRLTHFAGDYQYYLDKTAALALQPSVAELPRLDKETEAPTAAQERKELKRREAELRQANYRARKAQQDKVNRLEREIDALETRQRELTGQLESPETYAESGRAVEVNLEMRDTLLRLEVLHAEWEKAATRLASMP